MKTAPHIGSARGATPAQLREAERGFKLMLRRRFSAMWIAENAADLLAQANVEYAEWLECNPPARNPVGWLLTCAYRRAQNLLDAQTRRPPSASLDALFHLADSTPTPEEQLLDRDRQERLRVALGHLPEKECQLLALVYFGDLSIREAGRRLGWQKSAADRHHRAALDKLHALVGERSLLSRVPLGPAAWGASYGERHRLQHSIDAALTPIREALAAGAEGATWAGRQLGELGRRLAPVTDHAGAAASSGGGRLLGACGVAVATVVCGIAVSGVAPAGGDAALDQARPASGPERAEPIRAATRAGSEMLPTVPLPPPVESAASADPDPFRSAPPTPKSPEPAKRRPAVKPPKATTAETINEFGVEGGSAPAPEVSEPPPSIGTESDSSSRSAASSTPSGASSSEPTPPPREFGL